MASYLGNLPSNNFVSLKRQVITGNGGASYTLDYSVASVNDVAIFVNNVRQDPASYSISTTSLTLGGTISASDSCYIIFLGQGLQTVTPANNTITNAMLVDGSVNNAKIASDASIATTKLGTGAVIQVVTATNTVERTTTSSSFVTASNTLTVNITPSSTSNKILLLGSFPMHINGSASLGVHTIYRDSTNLGQTNYGFGYVYSSNSNPVSTNATVFLDSPNTTSQITYQVYIRATNNTVFISPNASTSTLTAIEIGA